MRRHLATLFLLTLPNGVLAQDDPQPVITNIGPKGEITKLHTGFKFTEGPAAVWRPYQGTNVYFSDIPAEKIYKVDADGKLTTFIEKSNRANGLMVSARGELFACEMSGRLVAYDLKTKERRVIADKYQDNRFNAPNDLVIDKDGGVYFTDPSFSAPSPYPQGKLGVYYVSPGRKVTRLIDDLPNPNGVKLSPDEKTLYVIPTGPADMMAYPVESPGKIGKGRVFCKLEMPKGEKASGGGDGMTVDSKGNLYITSTLGIQVFSPEGKMLGIIKLPEQPANCTFGGKDNDILYVTARTSLYKIPMFAKGHIYPAGRAVIVPHEQAVRVKKDDRIVFFGDSITQAAVGKSGYITMMREALTEDGDWGVELIGAGISGHKVPELQARVDRDVIAKKPAVVFIYIGINDVWHGESGKGTPKDKYEAGLKDLITKIKGSGAQVILCTPTVIGEKAHGTNKLDAQLDEYAGISRAVAKEMKVPLCDLRAAFLNYLKTNNPKDGDSGILTTDRVHLNAAGNRLVAETMLTMLIVPK